MSVRDLQATVVPTMRPLTRNEIDRRMDDLCATVTAEACASASPLQPRFISPAELVRRVRPFLSWN